MLSVFDSPPPSFSLLPATDLWAPNVMMPTAMPDIPEESLFFQDADGITLSNTETGMLLFHRNVMGHFGSPFLLRDFPFDENSLNVRFNASKLRDARACSSDDVVLNAGLPKMPGVKRASPFMLFADSLQDHIPEFEIVGAWNEAYIKNNCSKSRAI